MCLCASLAMCLCAWYCVCARLFFVSWLDDSMSKRVNGYTYIFLNSLLLVRAVDFRFSHYMSYRIFFALNERRKREPNAAIRDTFGVCAV